MFQVTKKGDNRVDLVISGTINSTEMAEGLDQLIAATEGMSKGKMLYTIHDIHMPTLGAIGVEMKRIPKLFSLIHNIDYAAVIADKTWMQKASEVKGALFPGLEIKAFSPGQETEAESWLDSKP